MMDVGMKMDDAYGHTPKTPGNAGVDMGAQASPPAECSVGQSVR